MKTLLSITANGRKVYVDNKTLEHLKAHNDVQIEDVKEAISKLNFDGNFFFETVCLDRICGYDNCVYVTNQDDVRMLYRKGHQGMTPIVFGRDAKETSLVCVGISTDEDGLDTLFAAHYGRLIPKEPWDMSLRTSFEIEKSKEFWRKHAIVYSKDILDANKNKKLA